MEAAAADNDDDEVVDDDTQWMKEKTMAFEKGKQKNRMSKIMAIGKNKLSTAKTKIIESKDKIKQKRDERKIKKNAAATAKQEEEENVIPVESKKAAKILTFNKRKEPSVPQSNKNENDVNEEALTGGDDEKVDAIEDNEHNEEQQDAPQ